MGYIAVEGNIGAGKTTLARNLAKRFEAGLILEKAELLPQLRDFYTTPEKYALSFELELMVDRYIQMQKSIPGRAVNTSLFISDFHFSKSLVFAGVNLRSYESASYNKLYQILEKEIPLPEYYIFIDTDVSTLLENIKMRGRDFEKGITAGYLNNIASAYHSYLAGRTKMKIIWIKAGDRKEVSNDEECLDILTGLLTDGDLKNGITFLQL